MNSPGPARVWVIGDAQFDETRWELRVDGQRRTVEAKPLALLHTLLCQAGEVATKDELLRTVWPGVIVTEGSLTTAVSKLRAVFGPRGRTVIEAVHGIGYRIGVPIELAASSERPRLAFGLQPGETVPNRPQWRLDRPLAAASDVWLVRHDKTGEARVFKFADTAERLEALKREVALSRILFGALGERDDLVRPVEWNFEFRPYFIESPYGGLDLGAWAQGRGGLANLPLRERVAVVARVARTVAAAHQVGVLHRDIKPTNILVADTAAGERLVRLVDFGAGLLTEAARLHAAAISGLGLTASGPAGGDRREGTLRYMAPELFAGGDATVASDVYALGILLYQMVVGDLDRPLAAGWEAEVDSSMLRADIEAAAAGNPERRLPSASLLAERLETLGARAAEERERQAEALLLEEMSRRLERIRLRRPWLVMAAASLVLGLIGVGAAATRAVHASHEARRQAEIAGAINSFLTEDLLARADPAQSGQAQESLVDAATRSEPAIDARFGAQPLIAGDIYRTLAYALADRTAMPQARQAFGRAIADFRRAQGAGSPEVALLQLRWAAMEVSDVDGTGTKVATDLIAAAKAHLPAAGPEGAEAQAWYRYVDGMLSIGEGHADQARRSFAAAAATADAMPSLFDQHARFMFRQREAFASLRLGDWKSAQDGFDALLARTATIEGKRSADALQTELNLGQVALLSGSPARAVTIFDRIYPDFLSVYGPDHRLTEILLGARAVGLAYLGRYDDSIRDDQILHAQAVAREGPTSFWALAMANDVSESQCRAGHIAQGLAGAQRVHADTLATFGPSAALASESATTVAFCLILSGRPAEATALIDNVDARKAGTLVGDADFGAQLDVMRAAIDLSAGDVDGADLLLRGPRRVYARPDADPYLSHWTDRLSVQVAAIRAAGASAGRPVAMGSALRTP